MSAPVSGGGGGRGPELSPAEALERLRTLLATATDRELVEEAHAVLAHALATLATRVATGAARNIELARMSAVGLIAAGVADELRGVLDESHRQLRAIVDDLDRQAAHARGPVSLSHAAVTALRTRVADAFLTTSRAHRLGEDLRRLAVPASPEPVETDVNTLVEAALNLVTPRLGAGADVFVDYSFLPPVRAYPDRLGLAVAHVLLNAAGAVGERGTIHVQTRVEDDRVVVSVTDTGGGIPAETLAHVFEPGFTTSGGAGLGLALVQDALVEIGGAVEIDSEPGVGTSVRLLIPTGRPED